MTYEEFKQNFLPEFLNITSLRGKIDYAKQNLQRIGTGSGRIVYDIDGEKVFKLAKNTKGMAQNSAEYDAGGHSGFDDIITKVFDGDDDGEWLVVEKAKPINEKRFIQLTGIPSVKSLYEYLMNFKAQSNGKGNYFTLAPELMEILKESYFAGRLLTFIENNALHVGDFAKADSYGEVIRDGKPAVVLTDYGLTDDVYDNEYRRKQNEMNIVEMYNFADGNDDMLGDLPPEDAIDTRQSMWALMPYGVGDGDGVVNEDFISFVQKNNRYPTRRMLPSAPYLVQNLQEVVNNIGEVLDKVDDKKKFYNNLLELQNYLIRGKFYDREPLELMELATPMGMGMEKSYAEKVAKSFAEKMNPKLNLGEPIYLGGGGYGVAFQVNGNRVLKLTTDKCEVDAGAKTHRAKPKHLIYVDKIYKIIDPERPEKLMFGLIEDFIPDRPVEKFSRYIALVGSLNDLYSGMIDLLVKGKSKEPAFAGKTLNDYPEIAKLILTTNPEANINAAERQEAYQFMMDLYTVKQELLQLGIKSNDYYEPKNLGYKNGLLVYYDIGNCRAEEPNLSPEDIITLEEDGSALYSTSDSVGRDNFPDYNNSDDGSPVQPNELPVNIFAEDLEYNHVVGDATQDKFQITERKTSYMPGSQAVDVKKKCRLAGNGSTSTACNQGDIGNLNFKSIDESASLNIPTNLSGYDPLKIMDGDQVVGEVGIMDRGVHGGNHYIAIDKIFINKNFRGKGYANDAMKLIFDYADKNNVIVTLTPDNMWGASVPKLTAWYKSLGFIVNKGKKKDFQTMQLMYRLPKTGINEETSGKEDVTKALEDLERARSVKYWFEPEFSSESGKYPQEGKPNSFIESEHGGTLMGNQPKEQRAWKSKDIVAYDENGKIVGVFSMAIGGPEKGAFKITTRKDTQRMGWGTKLLNRAEASGIDIVNNIKNNSFSSSGRDLLRSWLRKKLPQGLSINEEIDASEAYRDEGAMYAMVSGRKDVGIFMFKIYPNLYKTAIDHDFGIIPVEQSNHNVGMGIAYRKTPRGEANAKRLHEIMKSHGGYVQDKSPEEAREIGKLLDYSDESINSFIERIYGKKAPQAPEYADYVNMDESALNEYREQMEKVYGKTGIYDQEDMNAILSITGGDPYTKLIADTYYYLTNRYNKEMVKPTKLSERDRDILVEMHRRLKEYDKNVIPIHDLYAQEHNAHPLEKMNDLNWREAIIKKLKNFPSVLLRNLRGDIRKERQHYEIEELFRTVKAIEGTIDLLGKVKPENREKIEKKIYSSNNDTFEAVLKRLEDTTIPYLSQDDAPEGIIEKVNDLGGEAEVLYNGNNKLVVKINSGEAMGYIGCSSQWCFASNPGQYWDQYVSDSGFATIVFDFNEPESEPNRMLVVLEDGNVYDMYNEYVEDGWNYLQNIGVDRYIPQGEMALNEQTIKDFEKQIHKDNISHNLDKLHLFDQDDFKVYAVNGEAVRDNGFDEWVDGGHHYVDADEPKKDQKYAKFIPEDEIWVDDVFLIKPNDLAAILLHERLERFLMKYFGLKYENAHTNFANPAEVMLRKKAKEGFDSEISDKIYNIFAKKYAKTHTMKKKLNESLIREAQLMSLQDLPFKQEVEQLGGKIYSVGGAVRDEFLGKQSKDLDVLITGIPMDQLEEVLGKYGRVSLEGKSFGILKFKPKGATEDIDIAIPRTDTATGGGGHKDIATASDHALPIEKDLERRDFTINAIAKDMEGNLIDPYGGQQDLKNKIIRAVNPEAFSDDPLRMLRAVQFASRFGFTIEPKTMQMIKDTASSIKKIPPERILTEFDKIVQKGNIVVGANLLHETGLFREMFGESNPGFIAKILESIKKLIQRFGLKDNPLSKAKTMGEFIYLLIKGVSDTPSELYKTQLKGDIPTEKEIKALDYANKNVSNNKVKNRGVAFNMFATSPKSLESEILPNEIKIAAQELLSGKYPKTLGELAVNGNDLMTLGLKGKEIGDTLKMMLLKIYSDSIMNNKEELLSLAGEKKPVIKEEKTVERIEYGCLMLFLDVPVWSKITSVIDPNDLYIKGDDYGIEKEPHLTILYGFHDDVTPEQVFDLYKSKMSLKPIEVNISGISVFENPEFDVVKFDVNSELLTKINGIMKELPNTSKFPDYHAHITIAYVKKGEGKKYIKPFEKERKLKGNELVYTWKGHRGKDGEILKLDEKGTLNEFNYPEMRSDEVKYDINSYIEKYDIWNQGIVHDPSKESVLRFMEDEFPEQVNDERLRKELLWALTDRELLDEDMKNVRYSAVVLDNRSRQRLIERFRNEIPEGWEILAHHMTINLGGLDSKYMRFNGMDDIELTVNDIAKDDKVIALGVSGFGSKNAKPHITLAVNRQGGGKPKDSNNLTNWTKVKVPLIVTGKVTEVS